MHVTSLGEELDADGTIEEMSIRISRRSYLLVIVERQVFQGRYYFEFLITFLIFFISNLLFVSTSYFFLGSQLPLSSPGTFTVIVLN